MDRTDQNLPGEPVKARPSRAAPMVLGKGRYELLEFVSKGGMGAVYRARDVELERYVAVKCLLDVSNEAARRLAVKEARLLAAMNHPNIMRVYDILQNNDAPSQLPNDPPNHQVWIVSEWLEGKSLAHWPLPMPPAVVLAVMAQVYDALTAAHSSNVIHRDVKPGNVMIAPDGRVTLIDFGVAFVPGASTGETIAGSLRYTDPRTLEGHSPDASADLYSAALMQIEMMTGETVLPDLAPLPLYRHIKRHLRDRLNLMLDGSYPPLAALARRATERFPERHYPDIVGDEARAAAMTAHELLRKLTDLSPAEYLKKTLCAGLPIDPDADAAIRREAAERLGEPDLSPRAKAAWLAFDARLAMPDAPRATELLALTRQEATVSRKKRKKSRREDDRRSQSNLVSILSVMVLLLTGAIVGMLVMQGPPTKTQVPPSSDVGERGDEDDPAATAAAQPPAAPGTDVISPLAPIAPQEQKSEAPAPVAVHLTANAWARVIIDGKEAGRLPQAAAFHLAPGSHTLRLENPSVDPFETDLQIVTGSPQRLHFQLIPRSSERVIKLAAPGRLFIDGEDHGVVAEARLNLSYGTHVFKIERGGRPVRELSVALGPEGPRTVSLE